MNQMDELINGNYDQAVRIGSTFPLISDRAFVNLNNKQLNLSQYNIDEDSLIIYSNICNDFTDSDYDQLQLWQPIYKLEQRGVSMILYKRPEPSPTK